MTTVDVRQLIRNRDSIKKRLSTLENYIISITDESIKPEITDVELRYENSLLIISDFEEVQKLIEQYCKEKDIDAHYAERAPFENNYFKTMSFLKAYIAKCSSPVSHTGPVNMAHDSLQNFLLPKIKLATFNGDYEQWLEFKKSFITTIDSNQTLNQGQKYNFLKAALEGYARRAIAGCDESQDYAKAWQVLCEKFDKKKFLVDTHIKSIFNINSINKSSFMQFRGMIDELSTHLTALEGMKLSKDSLWDMTIIHTIYHKLDKITQNKWKEFHTSSELPTLGEFLEFLKDRQDILESMEESHSQPNNKANFPHQKTAFKDYQSRSQVHLTTVSQLKCNFCKGEHKIYTCPDFLKLTVKERWNKVKSLNLCSNCLQIGHAKHMCSFGNCRRCRLKHSTLLHYDFNNSNSHNSTYSNDTVNQTTRQSSNESTQSNNNVLFQTSQQFTIRQEIPNSSTLLSTVTFKIKDNKGNFQICRALLDSGAQSNLITAKCCRQLGLPLVSTNLSIMGINQVVSNLTKKTNVTIYSNVNKYQCSLCCYVTPIITITSSESINFSTVKIPDNIKLSDPEFYLSTEIDMLIGASLFWELLQDGKIKLTNDGPILQNTKLGWVVSGRIANSLHNNSICNFSKDITTESFQLQRFWEINEINEPISMSSDDIQCENLFSNNTTRSANGQFIVKIPFKNSPSLLGDSRNTAVRRFLSLEKRFHSDHNFYETYKSFMNEYIQLGHMTKITDHNLSFPNYYLPHHGILKETSLTTKLRVVFDGSCASDSGLSLNDLQFAGPKVQNDIFDILIRFRLHKYVVSADVFMMFRQILMHEEHRPLQQILWRDNPNEELTTYQLNTVTYGTTAAPYLAIKCINHLAIEHKNAFPIACNTILTDFYVDDLLSGSNNLAELQDRCKDISNILKSGNFILRKWISNDQRILQNITLSDIPNEILNLGESESFKTLGVQWASKQDLLKYKICSAKLSDTMTKRQVLSIISQVYDPLGLLGPVVIISKIIIQQLWALKISWDEPIPKELFTKWTQFYSSLSELNKLSIPRMAIGKNHTLLDIHCFCDASLHAYASCVYLRSISPDGNYETHLLCSKTKVSPLKVLTIPRLELCAALLGAQLIKKIVDATSLEVPIYYWTDSQIVLCWLKKEPILLQMFVANRVFKIQTLTDVTNWHYINTKENPADIASRGILPENIVRLKLWWQGPIFLSGPVEHLLTNTPVLNTLDDLPEMKKSNANVMSVKSIERFSLFNKFSSFTKLRRVTSYCIRFGSNVRKNPQDRMFGPLTAFELNNAHTILLKISQKESFPDVLDILRSKKCLPAKHRFSSLAPFIDENELVCVGGRLRFTHLDVNRKHPVLLLSSHTLTRLIFEYKHIALLHPGPQLLLASIRQFYWPISGRNLARKITKKCLTCFKFNPTFSTYPMSGLPDNRVKPSLPFQYTGVDYAGPFLLKDKSGRGCKTVKAYISVFVCFCTKAIHLELVSNLTSDCFLSCLKRFVSRRGLPSDIYSDNGTTFIGARNELKELGHFLFNNQNAINNYSVQNNIRWHFTPPYTPHFGGLWEAAVKSSKFHLKRTMLHRKLVYEDFNSLIIQIEGVLNSRPLYSMSNDPNDLEPLTPSHFLIGRPITMLPDVNLTDLPTSRLSRFQDIQRMYQEFWNRFMKEYISQLHQQYKWKDASNPVNEGSLVLIKNDHRPPCYWPIGRILRLFTSKDGVSRVAEVKTSTKKIVRSVRHLCPLPKEDETIP